MKFHSIFRPLLTLFIAAFCLQTGIGQSVPGFLIKGTLVDSTSSKAIEFATISILDDQQQVVALTYSDENGVFKSADVKSGAYFLNLSFVGYRQKRIAFKTTATTPYDFGTVRLVPDVTQLDAVTVTGTRQLVEQQPGMLIYNAEKDISNTGGTAADVLRKAPILNVDAAGNVTMRGNSNLRILINGKYSGQMARNAADALNMMPAGSIKSVEVITSPSARYDAEGAAGVINIITKKGNQSTSGTIEFVGGNLEQAINPRIALNGDKWNVSSTLHLHRFRNKELSNVNRTTFENGVETGKVHQEIVRDNAKPHSSGDVQIEYLPDSANAFNFSVNGWLGNWPQNSEQRNSRLTPDGQLIDQFTQSVKTKGPNKGIDLNLGYTKKFHKPGQELYLMAQHNRSIDDFNYRAFQRDDEQFLIYRETNDNNTDNREWTFQGDYILPLTPSGKHALESGMKAILRNVRSDYEVQASENGRPDALTTVPARTDRFDYRQDVVAAYSQLKFKWNSGWALHAGARVEGTFLEGNQRDAGVHFTSDFWNFVPSATIFKKLDANNNLTLSYTKRISRPSIWDLNPNRDSQDPKNIVVGNPQLKPEELNQMEFTYAWQTNSGLFLNLSAFGRKTDNSIESIVTMDSEGVATTTKQNLASNAQYGINLSTSFSLLPDWKINSNANIRRARFKSSALGIDNQGAAWGININTSWKLPQNFTVQAYGNYSARSIELQGFEGAWFYYSFSAKKELPTRKLTITLTTVSPFTAYRPQIAVISAPKFHSVTRNEYLLRSVKLSLNWEFGGLFKQGSGRKITNDDLKNAKQGG